MPNLILGPILRHVGENDATVWVETDAPCEVEILGHSSRTFNVEGHHYAIILIVGLTSGASHEYAVMIDGNQVWPQRSLGFPPSVIRAIEPQKTLKLVFGSCRLSLPHEPPYTLQKKDEKHGRGFDAIYALALRMQKEPVEKWPHALLLLGDQIYADEVSPGTRGFIHSRRSSEEPPGEQVADFEEYTHLYLDAWGDPLIRWLLSTVPSSMIFDDHDMHDDWNTSEAWVREMRAKPWWNERIVGGFMSYWIYQHLGNLSPRELEEDETFRQVLQADDGGLILRKFASLADRDPESYRWSFYRDFGKVRLIVMDSRAARVLESGRRSMMDEAEWKWIEEHAAGDFDHLLLGTTLPFLLAPGLHYLEAGSEAVCDGVWGKLGIIIGEKIRQWLDLEHWSAFRKSFDQLIGLLRTVSSSGNPPATVVLLSGDVHHAYLAEASLLQAPETKSAVYQAVCSPFRNSLSSNERRAMRFSWSRTGLTIGKSIARAAGVGDPNISWRLTHDRLWFDNQVAALVINGRDAVFRIEKTVPDDQKMPRLEKVFEYKLNMSSG